MGIFYYLYTMKGIEVFPLLTDDEKNNFVRNLNDSFDYYMNYDFDLPGDLILGAFIWSNTPEGNDYWAMVYAGVNTRKRNFVNYNMPTFKLTN